MNEDIKSLALKIDSAKQLFKNLFDSAENIKALSPSEIGMDEYAEELVKFTESRGRAIKAALREFSAVNNAYKAMETDSAILSADKALLHEKIRSIKDMSPLFAKQNTIIRKSIENHLNNLRKESVEFRHNVGIIKNYIKAPDRRNFYG